MIRTCAVLLAATLLVAPLGTLAADLVVWWDKGYYSEEDTALAEIIAGFEATGQSRGCDRRRGAPGLHRGHGCRASNSEMGLRKSARRPHGRDRLLHEPV